MAALAVLALAVAGDAALARRKVAPPESQPALTLPTELFGASEIAHPPATDFAKWTDTIARYERERRQEKALCAAGDCALLRWREFLATLTGQEPMDQLRAVNEYVNRFPYKTDLENYGVEDYWATPRELFAKGGDCEDYAIAKYLSLRALGWPAARLRVVVVHDDARDLVHAALIAYVGGTGYLLDIEISQVTDQRAIARYAPIFAISETGWWSYKTPPAAAIVRTASTTSTVTSASTAPLRTAVIAAPKPPEWRTPEWRSLTMRHKPGHAPKSALARKGQRAVYHAKLTDPWRSPHMKHEARRVVKSVPRPVQAEPPSLVRADRADRTVREEPFVEPAPGERIEKMFAPAAQ